MDNRGYYLFSGESIDIDGLLIRQPKIWEFLKYQEVTIEDLVDPFFVFTDMLDLDDIQREKYKNLDLIFYDHLRCINEGNENQSRLKALKSSLAYLCATNHVEYDVANETIEVNGVHQINRDNFKDVQDAILMMFNIKRPEKEIIEGSEFQRKKILELQEKRMRHRKRDITKFDDIIRVVMFGGKSFIPYKDVVNFTYLQLMDAYNAILTVANYEEFLLYKTSEKFEIKDEVPHWVKSLKIY